MRYKVNGGVNAVQRDVLDADDQVALIKYLEVLEEVGPNAPEDVIGMLQHRPGAFYFTRTVPGLLFMVSYYVIEPDDDHEPTLIAVHKFSPFDSRWI